MKRRLKQLDKQIKQWEEIVLAYPNLEVYKNFLIQLLNERDILASNIGKNK